MKFFAVAATFALAASSVMAAPAAAVEEKRLLGGLLGGGNGGGLLGGLLGGNSQVTKLNDVVSGVTKPLAPILTQISASSLLPSFLTRPSS